MQPNVLYLVLDCLRTDVIDPDVAPTLSSLAESNLSFESCVAPSNWSLPSHASIFTGEWPHSHQCYHQAHQLDELPLVESFNDDGYTTVGVSANIYASSSHGFDSGFDTFYETRRPLNPRGLNPFSAVRERQQAAGPRATDYLQVFGDAVRHERPLVSLGNYLRAVAIELDRRYGYRRRLPFVDHDDYGFLTRASERPSNYSVRRSTITKRSRARSSRSRT